MVLFQSYGIFNPNATCEIKFKWPVILLIFQSFTTFSISLSLSLSACTASWSGQWSLEAPEVFTSELCKYPRLSSVITGFIQSGRRKWNNKLNRILSGEWIPPYSPPEGSIEWSIEHFPGNRAEWNPWIVYFWDMFDGTSRAEETPKYRFILYLGHAVESNSWKCCPTYCLFIS